MCNAIVIEGQLVRLVQVINKILKFSRSVVVTTTGGEKFEQCFSISTRQETVFQCLSKLVGSQRKAIVLLLILKMWLFIVVCTMLIHLSHDGVTLRC